jgi:hypothetical protein
MADGLMPQQNDLPITMERHGPIPVLVYTAAIFVVVAWLAFASVTLLNGNLGAIGFFAIVLGCLGAFELGIAVFATQLIWLLSDDDADARAMPFLASFVLVSQSMLLMPMSILITIWMVPLLVGSLVAVGWYFQRATCLRIGTFQAPMSQSPLSLGSLVLLPFWLVCLGICGATPVLWFGTSLPTNDLVVYSASVLLLVAGLPLGLTYSSLALKRRASKTTVATLSLISLIFFLVLLCLIVEWLIFYRLMFVPATILGSGFFLGGQQMAMSNFESMGMQVRRVEVNRASISSRENPMEEIW